MEDKKIMIVDDEIDLLEMIHHVLIKHGFQDVLTASTGAQALALFQNESPDIIILDVMLPDIDGFSLLRKFREKSAIPIIMLTAKGEADDRFNGFELGADDYIIKPFLPKELVLRIQAIIKRAFPDSKKIISLQYSEVDLLQAQVYKNGITFPLTAKEFLIFKKLSEHPGQVVTIGSLCQAACGEIWEGYENSLMTHIRHIREKIENNPSAPDSLISIRGLGYKLIVKEN